MNAFHVCGIILAAWALIVSFLGITREGFPANDGAERVVGAISVVLVIAAIAAGLYTAATEEEEHGEEESEAAVLFLTG